MRLRGCAGSPGPSLFAYVVFVCSGLTSLSTIFSHIMMMSDCDRELNAHFYSDASLKYHALDMIPHQVTLS